MKTHNRHILFFLLLLLLGSACGDLGSGTLNFGGSDDDDTTGDDDDTTGDDDDTTGDDDDTTGDDDDTTGDDDTAPGSDHELSGDYDGEVWMLVNGPGGDEEEEPTCIGEAELEVESDGRFSTEAECLITWLSLTYSFELEGTVSSSNQFVGEVTERNSWTGDVSHYEALGWLKEGKISFEWDGATPGDGRASRPYAGLFWFLL